ncbi:hypothetical protein [Litorimonas sp. WD9-15]|uniref:hypothetical protein n=1 Tax=Litorimonas sp. WD9-15 TaxID=3418716 RepID=UPI003D01456C
MSAPSDRPANAKEETSRGAILMLSISERKYTAPQMAATLTAIAAMTTQTPNFNTEQT